MKKYFPVIYLKNGDACIGSPCENEEECRAEIHRAYVKYRSSVVASTFMVREEKDAMSILGSPKTRDIVRSPKLFE